MKKCKGSIYSDIKSGRVLLVPIEKVEQYMNCLIYSDRHLIELLYWNPSYKHIGNIVVWKHNCMWKYGSDLGNKIIFNIIYFIQYVWKFMK